MSGRLLGLCSLPSLMCTCRRPRQARQALLSLRGSLSRDKDGKQPTDSRSEAESLQTPSHEECFLRTRRNPAGTFFLPETRDAFQPPGHDRAHEAIHTDAAPASVLWGARLRPQPLASLRGKEGGQSPPGGDAHRVPRRPAQKPSLLGPVLTPQAGGRLHLGDTHVLTGVLGELSGAATAGQEQPSLWDSPPPASSSYSRRGAHALWQQGAWEEAPPTLRQAASSRHLPAHHCPTALRHIQYGGHGPQLCGKSRSRGRVEHICPERDQLSSDVSLHRHQHHSLALTL